MKKNLTLKCPHCNTSSLALVRDAIVPFELKQLKNGKVKVMKMIEDEVNLLDNCWLECSNCHEMSDSETDSGTKELNQLMDKISF